VALATECACINKTAMPAMYLNVLKGAGSKRAKCRDTTHYPNSFPDVVKLSLDTIMQSEQVHAGDAGQAMRKLAMVDTEAILLDLLRANERKAVILLREYSLVTVDDTGCAEMHAATQQVLRRKLTPKAQRPVLVAAMVAVLAAKLGKFHPDKSATFFSGHRYAQHAGAVAARAREWGVLPAARPGVAGGSCCVDTWEGGGGADGAVFTNIGDMCEQAGVFFHELGVQSQEALRMQEAALDSAITGHGDNHTLVGVSYTNIGNVYMAEGKYDEALLQYQKSLEIKIHVFGCESIEVAIIYDNIGAVYKEQGKYDDTRFLSTRKASRSRSGCSAMIIRRLPRRTVISGWFTSYKVMTKTRCCNFRKASKSSSGFVAANIRRWLVRTMKLHCTH